MTTLPHLSLVVPLHNEQESVAPLQAEIAAALGGRDYELILVDDGSTDGTAQRVKPGARVRLLRLPARAGQSSALYAGIREARGEIIVLLDGDLQNDPADIPRLLAEIEKGADLVCGYRSLRRDSVSKRLQSRVANAVRGRFLGDRARDTGCTLKAMRRACRDALVPFTGMHRFIPAFVKAAGFTVTEIPVTHRPREYGVSKYGLANRALRATIDMLGVAWLLSRRLPCEHSGRPRRGPE